jgi:hypothetical protein
MTDEEQKQFNEYRSHSHMLGRIACHVSDFCGENDTTEIGVLRLLASYYELKAFQIHEDIESRKVNP